jgi:hypothetical protein
MVLVPAASGECAEVAESVLMRDYSVSTAAASEKFWHYF